jgi:hypothetical protein
MSEIRGFASAQRQWENMEPSYANECECDSRYECEECGEDDYTAADVGRVCPDPQCGDVDRVARIVEVEHGTPVANCAEHGWCTGCYSRKCEDCNG